jgi:DNA-binding transcriptional MerR regulator
MHQPDLTGKLYYTISEVSEICGVKAHVLRYWESEFPSLRPRKDRSGSRRYRRRDIEEVLAIKSLLQEEGYRIAGARKLLAQHRQAASATAGGDANQLAIPFSDLDREQQLATIRADLAEVLDLVRDLQIQRRQRAEG